MAEKGKTTFLDKLSKYTIGVNRGPLFPDLAATKAVEHVEGIPPEAPLTRKQRIKRHCGRYWCCYVLVLIIGLAIFLPLFFIYAIPAISQDLLNKGTLTIESAEILQPRADNVVLTMIASIYIPGGFTVKTDPTTLDMYIPGPGPIAPFGQLFLPENTVHGNTSMGVRNQLTPLINQSAWQEFVNNTVFLDNGPLGLYGHIRAHLGKLSADLTLQKAVYANALNQFKGFSIDSATLLLPAESDGTNLLANATLPNQSILTLEIGNTTMNVLSGNLVIGTATIENLWIRPGNNSVVIRGKADLATILRNLSSILQTQAAAIRNGYIELTTKVTEITYEGSLVPYYTNSMADLPLTAQVPILGLIINTLKTFLSSPAATNGEGLLGALNLTGVLNGTAGTAAAGGGLSGLLNDTSALERIARRHLEHLMTL
ncbi:hypothetical protein VTN77DRAFT_8731 [Rasamsonia byssochlamydoides]|uniref:uncharacterized protein n=1 Tax=Rasamsonia byssochlamydoides TaxID=89139 RepID=UPI003741F8C6